MHLIELEGQDFVTGFPNLDEVCQHARLRGSFKSTSLCEPFSDGCIRGEEKPNLLLSCVQSVLVFVFRPIADKNTVGDDKCLLCPASLLPCEIAHLWDTIPFLICDSRQPTFKIGKLLLNFRPLRSMFRYLDLFLGLPRRRLGNHKSQLNGKRTSETNQKSHTCVPSAAHP
jgi:hypothetical protein